MTPPSQLHERLDRLVALQEQARHNAGMLDWRIGLRDPATHADLDRVESKHGRLLPVEALDLYRWHNGCTTGWFAPSLDFDSIEESLTWVVKAAPPEHPSNSTEHVYAGSLFPIFRIDRVDFSVVTTMGERAAASPVNFFDPEGDTLTVVADTILSFVAWLVDELESGNIVNTNNEIMWAHDPFEIRPDMIPHR